MTWVLLVDSVGPKGNSCIFEPHPWLTLGPKSFETLRWGGWKDEHWNQRRPEYNFDANYPFILRNLRNESLDLCMSSNHTQKDMHKRRRSFLEKLWLLESPPLDEEVKVAEDEVAPGQICFLQKKSVIFLRRELAWAMLAKLFVLALVCAYSCLSSGYLKMAGLFYQEVRGVMGLWARASEPERWPI